MVRVDTIWLRSQQNRSDSGYRGGISYEFLRLVGSSNLRSRIILPSWHVDSRTYHGEPDDSMIEVGIASVEAVVFEWRSF